MLALVGARAEESDVHPDFTAARQTFMKQISRIFAAHDNQIIKLRIRYMEDLDAAGRKFKVQNDLDKLAAVRKERQRFQTYRSWSLDSTPKKLRDNPLVDPLREKYQQVETQWRADYRQKRNELNQSYRNHLTISPTGN
ncbi:MAG: hypothetical protein AAF492_03995 [Verrucomicrobiota bacterium]